MFSLLHVAAGGIKPVRQMVETHRSLAHLSRCRRGVSGIGYLAIAPYISKHDAIGMTKSGAWNRLFIECAVAVINFPGWIADDLYAVNKVLNEYDVAPLEYLHALMGSLKWGRNDKGTHRSLTLTSCSVR
jgi:hypothetical protein